MSGRSSASGAVVRRRLRPRLLQPRTDSEDRTESCNRLVGDQGVTGQLHSQVEALQRGGDPAEVVAIVHADADLDEAAPRCMHEPELLTAVFGAEGSATHRRQPEVGVVSRGLLDIGDANRDGGQAMQ